MNNIAENTRQGDQSLYEKTLSQFNYAPLAVLYEYVSSLNTEEPLEVLKALMEKAKLNDDVNQQVQAWQRERAHKNRTRLIVKLINNTDQAFVVGENNLNLKTAEQDAIHVLPWDIQAFKFDFIYSRQLGSPSKDMFKHFIVFGDRDLSVLFDFGLRVNTSFGVISATLTPVRIHRATSIGATPIQCATRITQQMDEEPYSFTVDLTLG